MSFSSRRFDLKDVSDYDDFRAGHQLDFSDVDEAQAKELKIMLDEGRSFFDIRHFFHYYTDKLVKTAAFLFSRGEITRAQMGTLLEMRELWQAFSHIEEFSYFAPGTPSQISEMLGPEKEKEFLKHLEEQPKSEHYYFRVKIPSLDMKDQRLMGLLDLAARLKIIIKPSSTIQRHGFEEAKKEDNPDNLFIYVFSVGMRDALTKARYQNAKKLLPRLGKFTKEDIERSMMNNARYSAVSFPGVEDETSFHQVTARPFYLALHDEAHRQLISSIPNSLFEAMLYAIDVVRQKTGVKWSKEIWDSVDMEVDYFLAMQLDMSEFTESAIPRIRANQFSELLDAKIATEGRGMYLFNPSPYVDTTWLLLIDFVQHPEKWREFGLDIKVFATNEKYGEMYSFVEANKALLEREDSPARQVAILKAKFLKIPEVSSQDVKFGKKQGDRYLQILVDGKPFVLDKAVYMRFERSELDIRRLLQIPNVDLEYIDNMGPRVLELQNAYIFDMLIHGKFTIFDLKKFFPEVIEVLKTKSTYDAVMEGHKPLDQILREGVAAAREAEDMAIMTNEFNEGKARHAQFFEREVNPTSPDTKSDEPPAKSGRPSPTHKDKT